MIATVFPPSCTFISTIKAQCAFLSAGVMSRADRRRQVTRRVTMIDHHGINFLLRCDEQLVARRRSKHGSRRELIRFKVHAILNAVHLGHHPGYRDYPTQTCPKLSPEHRTHTSRNPRSHLLFQHHGGRRPPGLSRDTKRLVQLPPRLSPLVSSRPSHPRTVDFLGQQYKRLETMVPPFWNICPRPHLGPVGLWRCEFRSSPVGRA